jgi:hypothetical protein
MNKKQKIQIIVASVAALLIILWIIMPDRGFVKILGIIGNALLIVSMLISYQTEEKIKKGS